MLNQNLLYFKALNQTISLFGNFELEITLLIEVFR